jgi:hypothetical protein
MLFFWLLGWWRVDFLEESSETLKRGDAEIRHSNTHYGKDKTIERSQPAADWSFPSRMAKPFCSWKACGKRELFNDFRIEPRYPADFRLLLEGVSAGLEKW